MSLLSLALSRRGSLHRPAPSLLALVRAALAVRRSRRQLRQLDAEALRDIGVTRKSAEKEAKRPLWDVPSHWIE